MPASLIDHFRLMARNSTWANARLLGACDRLGEDDLDAPRTSFFPSLRLTLAHILEVDRNYLADLDGRGRGVWRDVPPPATLEALAAAQAEHDRRLVSWCDALDDAGLDRVVAIDRGDGVDYRETVVAILAHLFQHQIHHRGQVHAMLAGTHVPPPQLDEFFLADNEVLREEELRRLGL